MESYSHQSFPILLDGGMGQELIKRAQREPTPLWSTQVLIDQPELVEHVHLDYISAGARVITVNGYTLTPGRLARAGLENQFEFLHSKAIELAHSARKKALEQGLIGSLEAVKVAGCLPPLRASYLPESAPNLEVCKQEYQAMVEVQAKSVDLFLIETMTSLTEARASLQQVRKTDLPVWVAFVPNEFKNSQEGEIFLKGGTPLVKVFPLIQAFKPDAVLLNCASPEAITQALPDLIEGVRQIDSNIKLGAYGNRFVSTDALKEGGTVAALETRNNPTPEAYCDFALQWLNMGCGIVGGCCEINPDYIKAMGKLVRNQL